MKQRGFFLALMFIVFGFAYRLIPNHVWNFTPIAAMALVGGLYLKNKKLAFIIPFAALFLSDLILNNTINRVFFTEQTGIVIFDNYMIWTYGAYLLTVLLGVKLIGSRTNTKIFGGTVIASLLFFVLTNFGTFISTGLYPKNLQGLITCFVAALPFFKNTLLGNFLFISVFVFSIELLKKPSMLSSAIRG